ncbi:MAG: NAD(P)H-dependent oxidoreductase [Microvirga sp.]|nr:NAD(P)H-dependent oxidoreductase [Microvirga sp.]
MKRIAIIQGHPDPAGGHFCHALVQAYAEGAQAAGHHAAVVDPAAMTLPYIRNQREWREPSKKPAVLGAQAIVGAADHLVIVYPLWLGDMPAVLKSFLEHLSCGGFVMAMDDGGSWRRNLKGKSARIVVTMGMPALAYRLFFFSHSLKSLERNILKFSGVSPVRTTLMGAIEGDSRAGARARWLADMRGWGARAN